jgi:tRNA threonylcarbamoyladenosine biosynthesis protein TsaE
LIHQSTSVEQTESIGADLARKLVGGEVIALFGDLGAGKTQFVRGIVKGLGGDGRCVSSPTYVLLNIYEHGRLPVFHLDAYRVAGADDFDAIGFTELLEQGGVVAVEWPQRVLGLLPGRYISVIISSLDESTRQIQINWPGQ